MEGKKLKTVTYMAKALINKWREFNNFTHDYRTLQQSLSRLPHIEKDLIKTIIYCKSSDQKYLITGEHPQINQNKRIKYKGCKVT